MPKKNGPDRVPVHLRFWQKVDITNSCWKWRGAKSKGYGRIGIHTGKVREAHAIAYELYYNKTIPPGMFVCHKCDVRDCVRPDHLFIGTPLDNVQDMMKKGRHVKSPQIGEKNGTSKLTEEDVKFIRENYRFYSREFGGPALGKKFGITSVQVNTIVKNKQWRHI